jgi:hypothetical protein
MVNDYYTYSRKIRSGDLLVWNRGGVGGLNTALMTIIKLFTLSEYVHVGIAWKISGRVFVIEANLGGVRIAPLNKRSEFFHVPMMVKWSKTYDSYLLDKVGDSYSIMDAVKGYLGLFVDTEDRNWQCVELAVSFYKHIGLDLGATYTPAKLVNELLNLGHQLIYVNGRRGPRRGPTNVKS